MKDKVMLALECFSNIVLLLVRFAMKLGFVLFVFAFFGMGGIGICDIIKGIPSLFAVSHEVFIFIVRIILTITSVVATVYYLVSDECTNSNNDDYYSVDLCLAVCITAIILIWKVS